MSVQYVSVRASVSFFMSESVRHIDKKLSFCMINVYTLNEYHEKMKGLSTSTKLFSQPFTIHYIRRFLCGSFYIPF